MNIKQENQDRKISKLNYEGLRVKISSHDAIKTISEIFNKLGCSPLNSYQIANHLAEASLSGIESHGVMRTLQYANQIQKGLIEAENSPEITSEEDQFLTIDGCSGHGIPAMILAFDKAMQKAKIKGVAITSIINVGHTGRHGAFADYAAEKGFLSIVIGGGNREVWRQVAPYGGSKAKLPTNPYCIGIPGGEKGSFVMDFATSMIAGGWIYAAKNAGALLPEGCVIDKNGKPTINPQDYFDGGAILPAAQQKGYAMALAAELIAMALLGPVKTEANWLLMMIDINRFPAPNDFKKRAEEILKDIRSCPPSEGFEKVEIPGEREREINKLAKGVIAIPEKTWKDICKLYKDLHS